MTFHLASKGILGVMRTSIAAIPNIYLPFQPIDKIVLRRGEAGIELEATATEPYRAQDGDQERSKQALT